MDVRWKAIFVLVLIAGVPNAGPTVRRSSEIILQRPLRRLLAIEMRVLVAGNARGLAGSNSLVELDERIAQLNRFPVIVNELGLHTGEEIIAKRGMQLRRGHGLTQLFTLPHSLSLSVGFARGRTPRIETSAIEFGVATIGIGDFAVRLERRPQPGRHHFRSNVDAHQRIARAIDHLCVQIISWVRTRKRRILEGSCRYPVEFHFHRVKISTNLV
jgi:hypothetical protein